MLHINESSMTEVTINILPASIHSVHSMKIIIGCKSSSKNIKVLLLFLTQKRTKILLVDLKGESSEGKKRSSSIHNRLVLNKN